MRAIMDLVVDKVSEVPWAGDLNPGISPGKQRVGCVPRGGRETAFCDPEASTPGSGQGCQPAEETEEVSPHQPLPLRRRRRDWNRRRCVFHRGACEQY